MNPKRTGLPINGHEQAKKQRLSLKAEIEIERINIEIENTFQSLRVRIYWTQYQLFNDFMVLLN